MTTLRSRRKKYKTLERQRTVVCPPPCGKIAERIDTRRTSNPRLIRIRLYKCPDHDFETAESILGEVRPHQRAKGFIHTHTVQAERKQRAADDYDD